MADPVVGTAFVRIRALTQGVRRDIRKGFSDATKQSERDVKKSGESLGESFSEGVSDTLSRSSWARIVSKSLKASNKATAQQLDRAHAAALTEERGRNRDRLRVLQNGLRRRTKEILDSEKEHQQEVDRAHAEAVRLEQQHQREVTRAAQQGLRDRAAALDRAHAEALAQNRQFEATLNRVREQARRERQRALDEAHAEALALNERMERAGEQFVATGRRIGRRFGQEIALEIRRVPITPFLLASLVPVLVGATRVIAAFGAEVLSLLAPIGPALVASLSAGAQAVTAFAQGTGVLLAALKTEGDQLDAFNDRLETTKDRLRDLGRDIQSVTLDPFLDNIERATDALLPRFRTELVQTGRILADAADSLADLSEDPFFQARLGTVLTSNNRVLTSLSDTVVSLADAAFTLLSAATPLTEQFAEYVEQTAAGWAESLRLSQATGELAEWFRTSGEFLQQLGRIGENTRRALSETFGVANTNARTLWDGIEGLTQRWRDFSESVEGQNQLNRFFENSRQVTSEVTALFATLFRALGRGLTSSSDTLVSFIRTIRLEAIPSIAEMGAAFSGLGPVFNDLVRTGADFFRLLAESGVVSTFVTTLRDAFVVISDLLSLPIVGQVVQWSLAFLAFGKALNIVTLGAFTRALRPMLGRLGQVGTAITLVGRQAVTAAGGAGLGALRGSAGLLAGALGGPLGIAITGVTIGLGFLLKAHLDARQAAAEHEAQMLEFADTLDKTTGAATRQSSEWVANQISSRDYGNQLEQLGIETETFTRAALGNADALDQVRDAIDAQQLADAVGLYGEMSDRLRNAGVSQEEFARAVATGGDELESLINQLGPQNRIPSLDAWRRSVIDTSESHSDLEGFLEETNAAIEEERDRLREVAEASGTTSLEVQTLAESIGILGDEFSTADEKARALDDALNVLSGGERDVDEANRRLHESFRDVEDALVDTAASAEAGKDVYLDLSTAIDDSTGKLDQTTEVGAIVADTYDRLFDNAKSAALAIAESGGSAADVRVPFQQMEAEFRDLLETAGATPPQIDAIVNSLQDVPLQTIVDLILNSDQFDDTTAGAQQVLADLDGAQAVAELFGNDVDLASKIVNNIDDLDTIDNIVATATAGLDDDEAQRVYEDLLALLADLNEQNPTATADIDPRLLREEKRRIDRELRELDRMEPTPEVRAETRIFEQRRQRVARQLRELDRTTASPRARLDNDASTLIGRVDRQMRNLHRRRARPRADLRGNARARANALHSRLTGLPSYRSVTVDVNVRSSGTSGGRFNLYVAEGGVVSPGGKLRAAADGMMARRQPMVAAGGSNILWAEPETHNESYIPWAPSKRSRATRILDRTASEFGFRLSPQADGGIVSRAQMAVSQAQDGVIRRPDPSPGVVPGSSAGERRIVLELRSDGTAEAELEIRRLQKAIRVRGGDVQTVLGTGNRRSM